MELICRCSVGFPRIGTGMAPKAFPIAMNMFHRPKDGVGPTLDCFTNAPLKIFAYPAYSSRVKQSRVVPTPAFV